MSGSVDLMHWREYLRSCAIDVLCSTGILERCPSHGEVFGHYVIGLEIPYALANYKINKGDIVLPDGVSKQEFSAVLKTVAEELNGVDSCRSCDHYWAES